MIKPIQNHISFGGMQDFMQQTAKNNVSVSAPVVENKPNAVDVTTEAPKNVKDTNDSVEIKNDNKTKEKTSVKQKFLNVLKGYNKVTRTSTGVARGVADGAILAGATGFVGRNLSKAAEQNYNVGKVLLGMLSDTGKMIKGLVTNVIPSLITKSPLENLKNTVSIPKTFYDKCLKGNKVTTAVAAALFIGAVAFRTVQGKMFANKRNSEIDHYTGEKH